MLFENKGAGPKGGTYLVCDGAKRQKNCPSIRWRYTEFEASFLAFVEEINIESIMNANAHLEKRNKLERELAALNGELLSVTNLMEQTYAVLSLGGPVEFVTSKLNDLEKRRATLSEGIKLKSEEQQELLSREKSYVRSKEEIRQLVGQLQDSEIDELFKIRAQIASQLKVLVQTLSIASLGAKPRLLRSINQLRRSGKRGADDAMAHMGRAATHPQYSRRYFSVAFRDSNVRVVYPDDDDPLRYQQQIIASDAKGFEILRPEAPYLPT
jgi:hypothetical protein